MEQTERVSTHGFLLAVEGIEGTTPDQIVETIVTALATTGWARGMDVQYLGPIGPLVDPEEMSTEMVESMLEVPKEQIDTKMN